MLRCPKCAAPNPDDRVDCYNCSAPLNQMQATPGPPGTPPPAAPPSYYNPPPDSAGIARALSQWLHVLGWVVLGLMAAWVIYLAVEFGPVIAGEPSGGFFLLLATLVVIGLVGCVFLRAFGHLLALICEMQNTLHKIESNTRQNPNP